MKTELPRFILGAAILAAFGYALVWHFTPGIEETVKAIVMLLVGYYFGSSKGSADKDLSATGKPSDPVNIATADNQGGQA